jgi:ankyrin repeat protein
MNFVKCTTLLYYVLQMGNSSSNAKELLIKGILNDNCVEVDYALQQIPSNDLNGITINGIPILIVAIERYAKYHNCDIITSIINHNNTIVTVTDTIGRTPLHHTIVLYRQYTDYINVLNRLFKYGKGNFVNQEYTINMTPLDKRATTPETQWSIEVNTALWYTLRYGNVYIDIIKMLLSNGADTNYINNSRGWSLLQEAIRYGSSDIVDLLLTFGANPNCVSLQNGQSALHLAIMCRNKMIINSLINNGADVNYVWPNTGQSLLHIALPLINGTEDVSTLSLLIDANANVNAVDPIALQSVLMRAVVLCKSVHIIKLLINAGADVNYICPLDGHSVLMCAVDKCATQKSVNDDNVQLLFRVGANGNDKYRDGTTVTEKYRKVYSTYSA